MNKDELNKPTISTPIVMLMAIACGLCTGSNYYNQPLLGSIAAEFQVSLPTAAYLSFTAQIMYTLGLLLLVPLGDMFEKKKTIVVFMVLAAFGQLICAFSPTIGMMFIGTAISSLFSIAAQVLIPFSTTLGDPKRSAQIVGTLMSGLLMGILLARTVAGFSSTIMSWHAIYYLSGFLLIVVAVLIAVKLPSSSSPKIVYTDILGSMFHLLKTHQILQKRAILGGICFAAVSIVFTTMALLLSEQPYQFSDFQIGLVGLVGITGVIMGPWVGQQFQKGNEAKLTSISLYLLLISWLILSAAKSHLLIYLLGLVVIYISLTILHILNQNVVYGIDPHARSRLNSIYMTIYFSGAAIGSFVAAWMWADYGWQGCCVFGIVMALLSIIVHKSWKLEANHPIQS
jgi:predicted MFS family arabinose efflux permease